tara:strand:- start:9683 stop:10396 length:714 start_codon:yes stop_codon:yes gene_type:complete
MPLPKIEVPTFTTELPSTGQTIKFRPFLVKEEKVLLMAMETDDDKQITDAVCTLLTNCIQSRVKVRNLPMFDLEFLFLQIRGKSVSEELELKITCRDDNETVVDVSINLDDVKVVKPAGVTDMVQITDGITVKMKYPQLDTFVKSNFSQNAKPEEAFDVIIECIDQIIEGDEVHEACNASKKELNTFLDSLTSKQFENLQQFFINMPKLSHTFNVKNPNTGSNEEYTIEGLAAFFGS